jgi:hypothetical protein
MALRDEVSLSMVSGAGKNNANSRHNVKYK